MLSMQVKPIKNPQQSARYYLAKENYYCSDERQSQWQGLGAEKLGLEGEVTVARLESMLSGVLPNGEIIGLKTKSGEINHRCGYDLTFSAPKSLSYLAVVCGHKEFTEMHNRAVSKVLGIIEKEGAEARSVGIDGEAVYEKTGNLCFATVLHDTSRELDPELHTHALLMNVTQRLDEKWRALASDPSKKNGTMEWVMANQIFLGLVYRSEIALHLKEFGLDIENTGDPHGLFEIKHFDKELLGALSKRRTEIEKEVATGDSNGLKAYDKATQKTRKHKRASTPEALQAIWKEESAVHGVVPATYLERLVQKTKEEATPPRDNTVNREVGDLENSYPAIAMAVSHLEEKNLSFSYQEILTASLYFAIGESKYDTLIKGIDEAIACTRLVALDMDEKSFTTQKLIALETTLLEKLTHYPPQKKGLPLNKTHIRTLTDNASIQHVVSSVLSDKESVVRIKQQSTVSRELLKTLIDYTDGCKKITVLGTTVQSVAGIHRATHKAPQNLWQWMLSLGRSDMAQTVAGFNHRFENDHRLPFFKSRRERELLIVEDAQRLSPDEVNRFLNIASKRCAKVVFLEKTQGLAGFKSDIPSLLDKACVKTWSVSDKQPRSPDVRLVEVREKDARLMACAEHFVRLPSDERGSTNVLTLSRAEAQDVSTLIREKLKEEGLLSTDERVLSTLIRVPLTLSERAITKSYQSNYVLFHTTGQGVKKLTVLSVNEQDGCLNVRDKNGLVSKLFTKKLGEKTQVYEQKSLALAIGDKVVATGSLHREGLASATSYEVLGFTKYGVKLQHGKKVLNLRTVELEHVPLAHNYTKSLYAQDATICDHTILTLPSYGLKKNVLAVMTESSRSSLTILTDDVQKALRYTQKTGTQTSAISLTLDAAKHQGVSILNETTTAQLLTTLDNALAILTTEKIPKSASEKALLFAITHLSEHEAVFDKKALLSLALKKVIGHGNFESLEKVIDSYLDSSKLVEAPGAKYTTTEAVVFEEKILNTVRVGNGAVTPLMSADAANDKLALMPLTQGQKEACRLILSTENRFTMIQGYAGTGKTTMTKSAIDAIHSAHELSEQKIDIIAIAPTHQAVKEMRALGLRAQTLKSFLIEQEQEPSLSRHSLVLLDESSMVSNRDCAQLIAFIDASNARCTLLGDISQHQREV